MHAYETIRLSEFPDINEICSEGRASHVGKIARGNKITRFPHGIVVDSNGNFCGNSKTVYNDHGYCKSHSKKSTRRYLKHVDKANIAKLISEEISDYYNDYDHDYDNQYTDDYDYNYCGDYVDFDEYNDREYNSQEYNKDDYYDDTFFDDLDF